MRYPNACILQFAKAPRAGYVKTRMIPALGENGALQLHKKLVRHTWSSLHDNQVAHPQLWVNCVQEDDFFDSLKPAIDELNVQQGADLGERMSHALSQALRHHDMVVVVGSDCPVLDGGYLCDAFNALQQGNDVVLGPASDGGYVLIGMRRVYPELFEGIEWGTGQVFSQTRERLLNLNCDWYELPERWDVDRPEDLEKLKVLGLF